MSGMTKTQKRVLVALGIMDAVVIAALACIVITSLPVRAPSPTLPALTPTGAAPPTWTPVIIPTWTPKAAAPQYTPTIDPFFVNYLAEVMPLLDKLGPQLDDLGTVLLLAESPGMMRNEEWLTAVAVTMVSLRFTLEDIRAITAPLVATECHNLLYRATVHYDMGIDSLATSIDTFDSDLSQRAFQNMENASQLMEEFSACINKKFP